MTVIKMNYLDIGLYQDIYGHAEELGNRQHIVYGPASRPLKTRVREWYVGQPNCRTYGKGISQMERSDGAGFFLPEYGIFVGHEFIDDARTHMFLAELLSSPDRLAEKLTEGLMQGHIPQANAARIKEIMGARTI